MNRLVPLLRRGAVIAAGSAAIVLLLLWLVGAFREKVAPAPPREPEHAAPRAAVLTVTTSTETVYESAVGTIEAVHRIEIGSRLLARIERMHVLAAGQKVEAGEILVELDRGDLEARLEEAKAALRAATAARDQAARDAARSADLYAQKIAPKEQLDRDQTALARAEAEVERASHAVDLAETNLEFAVIRSPVAGIVIDKLAEQGDLAKPGQVLAALYDPEHLQLVASVREGIAASLRIGETVRVQVDALDQTCEAKIAEIVPEAERRSRAFSVKVTGPCPPGAYSGMFARLLLPIGTREQVTIPATAIGTVGQIDMVAAVTGDDRVIRRFVRTGRRTGDQVEVLSGLRAGERILAAWPAERTR